MKRSAAVADLSFPTLLTFRVQTAPTVSLEGGWATTVHAWTDADIDPDGNFPLEREGPMGVA